MKTNDRFFSLLGLARRANRISCGHGAALSSVLKGRASLVLITEDASERLKREFSRAASGKNIEVAVLDCTMNDIAYAVGMKAGVLTVNDGGFSEKIMSLCSAD